MEGSISIHSGIDGGVKNRAHQGAQRLRGIWQALEEFDGILTVSEHLQREAGEEKAKHMK